jgi:hypothetical protein
MMPTNSKTRGARQGSHTQGLADRKAGASRILFTCCPPASVLPSMPDQLPLSSPPRALRQSHCNAPTAPRRSCRASGTGMPAFFTIEKTVRYEIRRLSEIARLDTPSLARRQISPSRVSRSRLRRRARPAVLRMPMV